MIWIMLNIIMMTIMTSTFMMFMSHPLAIGLTLVMQTILISLMLGMTTSTFWLSYILFLVFLGGMLVLFIYVSSIASNEMFKTSISSLINSMAMSTIFMLMMKMNSNALYINTDTEFMSKMNEMEMMMMKFYNSPNNLLTIMLILYLLLTMIAINKITNIHLGPLRTKN